MSQYELDFFVSWEELHKTGRRLAQTLHGLQEWKGILAVTRGGMVPTAIIARELGIPAIVGCGNATKTLMYGQEVTVSCSEGDTGFVYEGALPFQVLRTNVDEMPMLPLDMKVNMNSIVEGQWKLIVSGN